MGIAPCIKAEVEFATYKAAKGKNSKRWEILKGKLLEEVKNDVALYNQVEAFGPREVLMYDILNWDERTKNIVEPLDPIHYFDGGDMLELQLKFNPAHIGSLTANLLNPPSSAVQNFINDLNVLGLVIHEKCTQYGLLLAKKQPSTQLNYSFWDKDGNILDPDHPAYKIKGGAIAEGMLKATYDAYPVYLDNLTLATTLPDTRCELRVDRQGNIRDACHRLEARPSRNNIPVDPFIWAARDLAGSLYGLLRRHPDIQQRLMDTEYTAPVKHVQKIVSPAEEGRRYKVVRHVLNGAYIDNGKIKLSTEYIEEKARVLAAELWGYVEDEDDRITDVTDLIFGGEEPYTKQLIEFFEAATFTQTGDHEFSVKWPEQKGKGIYRFRSKTKNKDKAQEAEYTIDIYKLSASIPHVRSVTSMICEGYDLSSAYGDTDNILATRQRRLEESPALKLMGQLHGKIIGYLHKRIDYIKYHLGKNKE